MKFRYRRVNFPLAEIRSVLIQITSDRLTVNLSVWERILSVKRSFSIPLSKITSVSSDAPPTTWKEIRAPGTFFPGVIKAGTYYTSRGKEFWLVRKGQEVLNMEVAGMPYKRFVLGVESNEELIRKLSA